MRIIIQLFLLLLVGHFSCVSSDNKSEDRKNLMSFDNSFKINQNLSEEFKIIEVRIKNGKLLIKAIQKNTHSHNECYFIIQDIGMPEPDFIIKDPTNDYVNSTFDVDIGKGLLVSYNTLNYTKLFVIGLNNPQNIKTINLNIEKYHRPGKIVLNDDQVFFLSDVFGVGVYNLKNQKQVFFHNTAITGLNMPYSSTISFPKSADLNLISGYKPSADITKLYAIDRNDSIVWSHDVKQDPKRLPIRLLSYGSHYIIQYDDYLESLDRKNGRMTWRQKISAEVSGIYKMDSNVLCISKINLSGHYPDSDTFPYELVSNLIDVKSGNKIWENRTKIFGIFQFCFTNDTLFAFDSHNKFTIDLSHGKAHDPMKIQPNELKDLNFEVLMDEMTGRYYLLNNKNILYW